MNRKWNDKVSARQLSKALAGFTGLCILSAVLFQNCSPVAVSDMTEDERLAAAHIAYVGAGEAIVDVGASQYDKAAAQFDVGLDSVPPLKQYWIVDNSGTMEANNLNLSNSFGAMFNQNNQDSLYKFDTTAYLLSTAQTLPSYSSGQRAVVTDIASRQNGYFSLSPVTENDFNTLMRNASQNSGVLPGDNVGIAVRGGGTDFSITVAPVQGKAPGGTFALNTYIQKPRNTNTTDFELEFQNRLAILQSKRVPTFEKTAGVFAQQSADVIDKESGLCAMARVLENPNGLYSASDMLAFTIVTDENENDVQGLNCLKRTAYTRGDADLINGRCSEFETAFTYAQRARDPYTCTVNGQNGYRADFTYQYNWATISYWAAIRAASITSTTPQTKISWKTPTTVTTYQQLRTPVTFYTQKNVAATYLYEVRRFPVKYYLPVCTKYISDGIETTNCVASATQYSGFVDVANFTTCNAAARALNPNAIIAATPTIPAGKLPDCTGTPVWQTVGSCDLSNTMNCRRTTLTAGGLYVDQGPISQSVVGDQTGNCNAAALSLNSVAITSTSTYIGADKLPVCGAASWVTLTGGNTCVASATCKVTNSAGTPANGETTVLGSIANGSAACTGNAAVPPNAIGGSVTCAPAANRVTSVACTAAEAAAGCSSVTTPETLGYKAAVDVANISATSGCTDYVNAQSDNRTDAGHPVSCTLKNENRIVSATRTFAQVSNNSLNVGDACGSTATAFYASMSSADKALLGVSGANSDCKIGKINNGSAVVRSLTGGSCADQLAADCSAINYRSCTTTASGGTFTASFSAPAAFSKIRMKDISCASKCKDLPAGACEASSGMDITFAQFLSSKLGDANKEIQCGSSASAEVAAISTITARPVSQMASFCPAAGDGTKRYFIATSAAYRAEAYVDEFVAGNSEAGNTPRMDLIQFIKQRIQESNLNVNLTVFIRRSSDPDGVGTGINYKGVDYEKLVSELTKPDPSTGRSVASGQVYSVLAPSYSEALTSLSAVLKSKLIRSFTVSALKSYQVITGVQIQAPSGTVKVLAIGEWSQSGQTITIANGIDINEGDKITIQYQNDDGYIKAQLKKVFVLSGMRPDQIIKSVEHLKISGERVFLTPDQYLKDGNKIVIDPKLVINGGDRFVIKFKNDVAED